MLDILNKKERKKIAAYKKMSQLAHCCVKFFVSVIEKQFVCKIRQ